MFFSLFRRCNDLPLEKDVVLYFNKFESLLKYVMCQVWLNLGQWFWRVDENMKSFQTDGQTDLDEGRLSFQFRWAKNVTERYPQTHL